MSTSITAKENPQSISLPDLAQQIRSAHAECEASVRQGLVHAIKAGDLLIVAKKRVSHGQWLTWLAQNPGITARLAQRYMQVARECGTTRSGKYATRGGV